MRHIFLARHGQYNLDDDAHGLTELGKHQARKTGQRLRAMADGLKKDHYGEIKVKWQYVQASSMLRAKETAAIIAEELGMTCRDPDPMLAEGNPCMHHPGEMDLDSSKKSKLLTDAPRIEASFRKYVTRADNYKKVLRAVFGRASLRILSMDTAHILCSFVFRLCAAHLRTQTLRLATCFLTVVHSHALFSPGAEG